MIIKSLLERVCCFDFYDMGLTRCWRRQSNLPQETFLEALLETPIPFISSVEVTHSHEPTSEVAHRPEGYGDVALLVEGKIYYY